jgi:RNA recognition motif-containing protein
LPQSLTDEQLCSLFSKVGPVVSAKIIRDSSTNYSYGYGFVEMSCPEDAEEAIEQLKGQ